MYCTHNHNYVYTCNIYMSYIYINKHVHNSIYIMFKHVWVADP